MKKYWQDIDWQTSQNKQSAEGESTLLSLSCEKALSILSWKTILDIDETAEMTVRWYRAYNEGENMFVFSKEQLSYYIEKAKTENIDWVQ